MSLINACNIKQNAYGPEGSTLKSVSKIVNLSFTSQNSKASANIICNFPVKEVLVKQIFINTDASTSVSALTTFGYINCLNIGYIGMVQLLTPANQTPYQYIRHAYETPRQINGNIDFFLQVAGSGDNIMQSGKTYNVTLLLEFINQNSLITDTS